MFDYLTKHEFIWLSHHVRRSTERLAQVLFPVHETLPNREQTSCCRLVVMALMSQDRRLVHQRNLVVNQRRLRCQKIYQEVQVELALSCLHVETPVLTVHVVLTSNTTLAARWKTRPSCCGCKSTAVAVSRWSPQSQTHAERRRWLHKEGTKVQKAGGSSDEIRDFCDRLTGVLVHGLDAIQPAPVKGTTSYIDLGDN